MTISEKVAYLKGLAEGMKIDTNDNTGKLIAEIIDVLGEISDSIEDLEEDVEYLSDYAEELDEDLGGVEEYVFGDDECDCCCDDEEDYDEDDDFEFDEDYDDEIIEIECPMCGEKICVPPTVDYAHLICPACNEEFSYIEDEDPADED